MRKKIWKVIVVALLIICVTLFSLSFYFAKTYGRYRLDPGERVAIKVEPNYMHNYFKSELYLESEHEIAIKLTGPSFWKEAVGSKKTLVYYYYDIEKSLIESYEPELSQENVLEQGYHETTIDHEGLILKLQGERVFDVTEDKDYYIEIENLSNEQISLMAHVVNR